MVKLKLPGALTIFKKKSELLNNQIIPGKKNLNLKFNLLTKKQSYLGIDIGTRFIKAVQIDKSARGLRVQHYAAIRTPQDIWLNEFQPEMLAAELEKLIESVDIKKCKINITIGSNKIITRHIHMPDMPAKELANAIKWEAEKYIPIPVDKLILDHVILEPSNQEGIKQNHILLAAITRDSVKLYHHAFWLANLQISAIDLASFSIWRVFVGLNPDFPPEVTAIIDIGYTGSQMVVVQNRRIVFTRMMPIGARTIFDSLVRSTHIDMQQIVETLESGRLNIPEVNRQVAAVAENTMGVEEFLGGGIADFAREVRRSLEFFRTQGRNAVKRIIVTGGAANFVGIDRLLARELNMPIELGVIELPIKDNPDEKLNPSYAAALGLALREVVQ